MPTPRKGESLEEFRARNRESAKRRYQEDPERHREYARKYREVRGPEVDRRHHLKSKYGLTVEDYAGLVEAQSGVCAVCGGPQTGPGKNLHVDHDHTCGVVRGLLCSKCNTAIGLMDDDPERIRAVLAYVERHRNEHPEAP